LGANVLYTVLNVSSPDLVPSLVGGCRSGRGLRILTNNRETPYLLGKKKIFARNIKEKGNGSNLGHSGPPAQQIMDSSRK
jgi:hypothetical protein